MERELETPYGLYWECEIGPDEPPDTYAMGKRVAATIADMQAAKTGKHYVVATSQEPLTLYVFALDHPDLPRRDMTMVYEISPSGKVVKPS